MYPKPVYLLLAVALAALLTAPVLAQPLMAPSPYEVVDAVNALRASHGLKPYKVDAILMAAAQGQADYLASIAPNVGNGHIGPGGTDADARALALGYPYVPGLDINENWGPLPEGSPIETLIFQGWSDDLHMHTMLHERGQHVGAGVAVSGGVAYVILDVAAFWGDAGLTEQPVSWGSGGDGQAFSQFISPVIKATPALDGSITHVVQSGQSLWMLSHHYGVEIETLKRLNNLSTDDTIFIGQKILIQPTSSVTPTAVGNVQQITAPPTQTRSVSTDTIPLSSTEEQESITPTRNPSIWFLAFFALFGVGLILVVLGMSGRS